MSVAEEAGAPSTAPLKPSRPRHTVHRLLFRLVFACMLPGVIGTIVLSVRQYDVGHQLLERDTHQVTRSVSQALDLEVSGLQGKLQMLGLSGALQTGDLSRFYQRAKAIVAAQNVGGAIVLIDATGQQVLNTLWPLGTKLPKTSHPDMLRQTFESGQPGVSDLHVGDVSGARYVALEVPIKRDGQILYALDFGVPIERLRVILAQQPLPPGWVAAVVDRNGVVIARTQGADRFVGQHSTPEFISQFRTATEGVVHTSTLEGVPSYVYYSRSGLTDWTVAIAIPREGLEADLIRDSAWLALGVIALFGMGIGLASYMADRIARSVKSLTEPAQALEAGERVVVPQVHFREAEEVAQAMARTASILKERTQALHDMLDTLQERESDLSHAQQVAKLGSWHWDVARGSATVSEALRQLFGPDRIAPLVDSIEAIFPPAIWLELEPAVRETLRTGKSLDLELRTQRDDGRPLWIHCRGEAERAADGQVLGMRGTVQDVTGRRQADEWRRVGIKALKVISQGVLFTDREGHILWANDAFEAITGFGEAQIMGRTCNFVQGLKTDPQTVASIGQCLARGEAFSGEILNYRQDGVIFWNELSIAPVYADDGRLTHFVGIIRDITERRASMEEIANYRLHLEQLVNERTDELARARDVAESANQAKSAFLATMSHELRTPLITVVGLIRLLADSPLNRRQRDYANKVLWSAQALRAIIDDILDFSKIEAGALALEDSPFSLQATLRTIAAVVGVGLGNKPIEAVFDVSTDVPDALVGDALRLQQILLNLTSNAAKFTEFGTISVTVRCAHTEEGACWFTIAIRDTGIGIAAQQLESIFGGFVQADASISRKYGGTGLGLAISARLARLMGGRIEVDSVPGSGSEFRLCVPMRVVSGPFVPLLEKRLRKLRILVVDDHPLVRELLVRACGEFGWQAVAVDGGLAGLDALRRSQQQGLFYDLMLLDWRMPGMDGLDMLRQALASADIGLPMVILMASVIELEQAVAASDDLHLDGITGKPLTPSTLLEAVLQAYEGEYLSAEQPAGAADHRLAGYRLLLAEDNEINREVMHELLTRAGARVVSAINGQEALDLLRKPGANFDAVLLDLQMPVMDGYAAARIIREDEGLRDLPIIAITANAQVQDREKVRQAGFTAHIVKPLEIEALLDILELSRQTVPGDAQEVPATGMRFAGLDAEAALQAFGSDKQLYARLLRKFVMQHGGDAIEARRLFEADDLVGSDRVLHGLSGVASILRATDLARIAALTKHAVSSDKAGALAALFDDLQAAMDTVKASIEELEANWTEV